MRTTKPKPLSEEEIRAKHNEIIKQEFPTTEEWVLNWLNMFFKHREDNPKVFKGITSFMDIADMLRNADTLYITECALFDTDITSQSDDNDGEYMNITFHVCVRSADALDGDATYRAKKRCLHIVREFRKFLRLCKGVHNNNVRTLEESSPATTGAPFLDGWNTMQVNLRYYTKHCQQLNWCELLTC